MSKTKNKVARKATKLTSRHAVHGTVAKARRDPLRSGVLLAAGLLVGALAGWTVGRSGTPDPIV